MNKSTILITIITAISLCSCQDYKSIAIDESVEVEEYDGTFLEYLSDPLNNAFSLKFDSMLYIINNIPGLKEELAKEGEFYTIYATSDVSFDNSLKELNTYRTQKKLGGNISLKDLLIEPFSVDDTTFVEIGNKIDTIIDTRHYDYRAQVDSLFCRYLFNGEYTTTEILNNESSNISLASLKYGYLMNMACSWQPASGIVEGGTLQLGFSDMNESQLMDKWKTINVARYDIYTSNAIIHILPTEHTFGYNKFINYFKNRGNENNNEQ